MERIRRKAKAGFTLVEILVVITIIGIVAVIALPVMNRALGGRQPADAARVFSAGLVGARDLAINRNEPCGIRLLPDPFLTIPAVGQPNAGTTQLCYNRYVLIEPGDDIKDGRVSIGPQYYFKGSPAGFPPTYNTPDGSTFPYPFPESDGTAQVLMIEASPYSGGFSSPTGQPNDPTNWYWNVRVGDKIKVGTSGRLYTIVGPCTINPYASGTNYGNVEMFVNVGPPGTPAPLVRSYYPLPEAPLTPATIKPFATANPEFLFVVNGADDDLDGYVDEGADGFNNNANGPTGNTLIDELIEWETETWIGTLPGALKDLPTNAPLGSPSGDWLFANYEASTQDVVYEIERRPVPRNGTKPVNLPEGMVIDATTWDSTQERSRIPVTRGSLYCDLLVNPSGNYIPATQYSSLTASSDRAFLHFWVTAATDVYPANTVVANPPVPYHLPMPEGTPGYPPAPGLPILKEERRLVTMFARSGLIVTNPIDNVPATSTYLPGEGFNVNDVNYPFIKAQQGIREAR